jgi:hypothetical protein
MRTTLYLGLSVAWLAAAGCFSARQSAPAGFEHLAARNLTQQPVRWIDECDFKEAAYAQARETWRKLWEQERRQAPDKPYPHDFARGFVEGYVDYLDAGGSGEPPRAAPFRYRLLKYKNPAGVQAAEEWFAGFRYGASAAEASGLRNLILVPLSGPITPAAGPRLPPVTLTPGAASETPPGPGTPPPTPPTLPMPTPDEELPAPRVLPSKDGDENTSSAGAGRLAPAGLGNGPLNAPVPGGSP